MKKPSGYWNNPKTVDEAFDEIYKELGRVPTFNEFNRKCSGALKAITDGRYNSEIKNLGEFLASKGLESPYRKGKWTPEAVDKAFDGVCEELGRVPTIKEFAKRYGGALNAIFQGRYDSNIKKWSEFLVSKGLEAYWEGGKWTPEAVDEAFDGMCEELGRVPTQEEFNKKYSGAFTAIIDGRYNSEIKNLGEFLASKGLESPYRKGKWTPEAVDKAFDGVCKELGRAPTINEFAKSFSGALNAIFQGRYDPEINKWSKFLKSKGFEPYRQADKWTPEAVDEAFDDVVKELGRVPTFEEFSKKCGGAANRIKKGRYDSEIRNWGKFLTCKGAKPYIEINKWMPEIIEKVFDNLCEELGRVPTYVEFKEKYSGALDAIVKLRYNPEIRNWGQFVTHRITSKLPEVFTLDNILDLGFNDKKANNIVENALTLHRIYKLNSECYTTSKELFETYKSLQAEKKGGEVTKKRRYPSLQKSLRIFPLETEGNLVMVEPYEGSRKTERNGIKEHERGEMNSVSRKIIKILNAANIVPSDAFEYENELAKRFSSKGEYIKVYEEGLFPLTTNLMRIILERENGKNILDIGSGVGAPTLQAIMQLGKDFHYSGLDCVDEIQQYNREKYGEMFHTLMVPYEMGNVEGEFDTVTASLVLDSLNLPEIFTTLMGSHQFLESDGKIITVLSKAREEKVQQVLSILKGMGYELEIEPRNYYFNLKLKDMAGKTVNNYFYIIRAQKEGELESLDLSKQQELYLGLCYLKAGKFKEAKEIFDDLGYSTEEAARELVRLERHDYKEPPFTLLKDFIEKRQIEIGRIEGLKKGAKNSLRYLEVTDVCEGFALEVGGNDFSNREMLEESLRYLRNPFSIHDKKLRGTIEEGVNVIRGKSRNKKRRRFRKELRKYLQTLLNSLDSDI